eukprot:5682574-Prymnesium_polylepis.2
MKPPSGVAHMAGLHSLLPRARRPRQFSWRAKTMCCCNICSRHTAAHALQVAAAAAPARSAPGARRTKMSGARSAESRTSSRHHADSGLVLVHLIERRGSHVGMAIAIAHKPRDTWPQHVDALRVD